MSTPLIGQLIEALRCLPGVGPKSAQRMAYHLLEREREGARQLAEVLIQAVDALAIPEGDVQSVRDAWLSIAR